METPEDGTGSAGSGPAEPRPHESQPGGDPAGQPGAEETAAFPPGPGEPPDPGASTPQARAQAVTAWQAFRAWRRSRPFWGGLLLVLAGLELLAIPLLSVLAHGSVKVVIYIGIGGVFGVLIGGLLVACGLLIWFHPVQRIFYAIAGVLLAVASFVALDAGSPARTRAAPGGTCRTGGSGCQGSGRPASLVTRCPSANSGQGVLTCPFTSA